MDRRNLGVPRSMQERAHFPPILKKFIYHLSKISELQGSEILPRFCRQTLWTRFRDFVKVANVFLQNRWETCPFLCRSRSFRNRRFFGAKMEAFLTVTWWLGHLKAQLLVWRPKSAFLLHLTTSFFFFFFFFYPISGSQWIYLYALTYPPQQTEAAAAGASWPAGPRTRPSAPTGSGSQVCGAGLPEPNVGKRGHVPSFLRQDVPGSQV